VAERLRSDGACAIGSISLLGKRAKDEGEPRASFPRILPAPTLTCGTAVGVACKHGRPHARRALQRREVCALFDAVEPRWGEMRMFLFVWLFISWPLLLLAQWLFRRLFSDSHAPGRWDWRRSIVNLLAMIVAAFPAWWLLDMSGEMRFSRLIQAGDFAAASLSQNQPHPLIRLDGMQIAVVSVVLVLCQGLFMTFWPSYWARRNWSGSGVIEVGNSTVRRFRVYGIVILVLALVAAAGLALTLSGSPT